jgi:hypothetical protein
MVTIFISHAPVDAECAGVIRQGLEERGYGVWKGPDYPTPADASYPYVVENGIMGSAAVLLVWSEAAARFDWGKRHLAFAQRLGKPVVPVVLSALDETPLPGTLLVEPLVVERGACDEVTEKVLPRLPEASSDDAFLKMGELAAHEYISKRKEAIELAAGFARRGEHSAEALAILEYLAYNDLMNGVRVKAQEALDAQPGAVRAGAAASDKPDAAQTPTRAAHEAAEKRHKFRARCKNGHVSTFDKAVACSQRSKVARETPRGFRVALDELVLTCPVCQVEMAVDIDCEGY